MSQESHYHIEDASGENGESSFDSGGYSILFQLIISFAIGFLFSSFSRGFFYLLIFIFIFELANVQYQPYSYNNRYIFQRVGIIASYLLGFMIGRYVMEKDHSPLRHDFHQKKDKRGIWFNKKEEYTHTTPTSY